MKIFENRIDDGFRVNYCTRYIASWLNVGGNFDDRGRLFKKWLKSLGWLSDDQIRHIYYMAIDGKLELESSAEKFIENETMK